jgi:predicted nucleotidyltransferase
MLQLTSEEQAWLDAYRAALDKKHPGAVHEILIYGSKARGQAHAESDLDVLLIVKNSSGKLKRELRRIGYLLAANRGLAFHPRLHPRRVGKPEAKRLKFSQGRRSRRGTHRMNRNMVFAEWNRARESLLAADTLTREGLFADAISWADYAILHGAKAALQVHDVAARYHHGR